MNCTSALKNRHRLVVTQRDLVRLVVVVGKTCEYKEEAVMRGAKPACNCRQ